MDSRIDEFSRCRAGDVNIDFSKSLARIRVAQLALNVVVHASASFIHTSDCDLCIGRLEYRNSGHVRRLFAIANTRVRTQACLQKKKKRKKKLFVSRTAHLALNATSPRSLYSGSLYRQLRRFTCLSSVTLEGELSETILQKHVQS